MLARELDQFGTRGLLGKASNLKIGSMHPQQQPRALANCFFIIADARAIGCAHFQKRCPRLRHDVGDAEGTADLDQLAARDDYLAALGQSVERQQDGSGIVVYDDSRDRCFPSAEQRAKEAIEVNVALAASAGLDVKFKI